MTSRPIARALLILLAAAASTSCSEGELVPVRLDLCPAPGSAAADQQVLDAVTGWTVEVWGLELTDVAWRRVLGGGTTLTGFTVTDAIPPGEDVRIFVQGRGNDGETSGATLAVGMSGPLVLYGAERICLCVAPTLRYDELCQIWSCSFDASSQRCL